MRYVPRRAEAEVRSFVDDATPHKPVLLLEGARQVGKTALALRVLGASDEPSVSINLERDTLALAAFDDCREFAEFEDVLWVGQSGGSIPPPVGVLEMHLWAEVDVVEFR